MICSLCGGSVEWQGPMSMLTHTKCLLCGAINVQVVDPESDVEHTGDQEAAEAARRSDEQGTENRHQRIIHRVFR